jgi:hypothetical protein
MTTTFMLVILLITLTLWLVIISSLFLSMPNPMSWHLSNLYRQREAPQYLFDPPVSHGRHLRRRSQPQVLIVQVAGFAGDDVATESEVSGT